MMPPMYVPIPIIINGGGGDGTVSGGEAIVIWICIIVLLILLGILTYSFVHDILEERRGMKKGRRGRR